MQGTSHSKLPGFLLPARLNQGFMDLPISITPPPGDDPKISPADTKPVNHCSSLAHAAPVLASIHQDRGDYAAVVTNHAELVIETGKSWSDHGKTWEGEKERGAAAEKDLGQDTPFRTVLSAHVSQSISP
jgi:hypothetical protein